MDNTTNDIQTTTELLTTEDVAALLRVNPSTVRSMRRQGRIPTPIHLSRHHVRWSLLTIQDWIKAGCPQQLQQSMKGDEQ